MKSYIIILLYLLSFLAVAESYAIDIDDQCNENFQKVYTAKRSCVFDNDQSSCNELGVLSSMYPLAAGAAGAFAAKMWISHLEKRSDIPNARAFVDKLRAVIDARDVKAQKIIQNFTHIQDAQKEVLGRTFRDESEYKRFLDQKPDLEASRLRKVINDKQRVLFEKQMTEAIANTKDTLIREALEEVAEKRPYKSGFHKVIREQFGESDVDKVIKFYDNQGHDNFGNLKTTKDINVLSKRERLIYDLLRVRDAEGLKTVKALKVARAGQNKRASLPKTAGIAAGVGGGLLFLAVQIGANMLDKRNLDLCKNELKLNDDDLSILNGQSYAFSEANAKSSTGLIGFTCSRLKIHNVDEVLTQTKSQNDGKVSPGICEIMKNEMKEIDSAFESITSVRNTGCDGFKAANVEMTGSGFQKTFVYHLSSDTKVEAPFDGKNGWPDYTQAKIFRNGSQDQMKTDNFISMHQRYIPADYSSSNPNPRWDLSEMGGCLDPSKTSDECKMQRSAIVARLYYSNFGENCAPTDGDPAVAKPIDHEMVR